MRSSRAIEAGDSNPGRAILMDGFRPRSTSLAAGPAGRMLATLAQWALRFRTGSIDEAARRRLHTEAEAELPAAFIDTQATWKSW
jgi:hypothetical protein